MGHFPDRFHEIDLIRYYLSYFFPFMWITRLVKWKHQHKAARFLNAHTWSNHVVFIEQVNLTFGTVHKGSPDVMSRLTGDMQWWGGDRTWRHMHAASIHSEHRSPNHFHFSRNQISISYMNISLFSSYLLTIIHISCILLLYINQAVSHWLFCCFQTF